jgi:Histidine kinase
LLEEEVEMHVAVEVVTGFAIAVSVSTVRRPHGGTEGSPVPVDPATLEGAQLQVLRAQITSHFVYNALAAVAGDIRADPDEARELLVELAEFTRYAADGDRLYVTLAEELEYVARYLHLTCT